MDLLLDRRRTGAANMALDSALLARGEPAVRLYGWEPACVSLGYTQGEEAVDRAVRAAHGIDLVERPTGGGAILHAASEVTYAVVLPTSYPGLPDDLFGSYRFMAEGVRHALGALGLDAEYRQAAGGKDAFCYLREAGVAITVGGRKVSGGAQRRTRTAILQHGTVLVESEPDLLGALFREDPARIAAGVGSLADLGVSVERDELVGILADSFVATLAPDRVVLRDPPWGDALLASGETRLAPGTL